MDLFGVCRGLPGQCRPFKRRKRVFWHHKKVLYRGNFTQFNFDEPILSFLVSEILKINDFGRN